MEKTSFYPILSDTMEQIPGARGAVFVDWEGESVDQVSVDGDDTTVRLVGAHWGIIHKLTRRALRRAGSGDPELLVLSFGGQQVVVQVVTDDYLLVVHQSPDADLEQTVAATGWAAQRLREEM